MLLATEVDTRRSGWAGGLVTPSAVAAAKAALSAVCSSEMVGV